MEQETETANVEQEVETLASTQMSVVPPNLMVKTLGPGDHPGFDIDFPGWTGNFIKLKSSEWLSQGFDGVLFQGAGQGLTRIRPQADTCIFVGPHNGIVAFKDLSLGCKSIFGRGKALHMGLANPTGPIHPKFMAKLENVEVYTEANAVWGLFGYQCDWFLKNVTFNLVSLYEHGLYAHGFAKQGAYVQNLTVNGVGAECLKFTARPSECQWIKDALIWIKESTFKNWNQPWSWRGGAGFTAQGSSANILIENSYYWGGQDSSHGRCIMIDDSGSDFYSAVDGTPGSGPANGHVIIRRTGVSLAGEGPSWHFPIMRIGTLNPNRVNPWCARTLHVTQSGIYGTNTLYQIGGGNGLAVKGKISIRDCNTPSIRSYLDGVGMKTDFETKIAGPTGVIPVSQGLVYP